MCWILGLKQGKFGGDSMAGKPDELIKADTING